MQRTLRILTHGWIGASALNLFTGGYYPATVGPLAQGRVCLTDIHMTLAGALLGMASPSLSANMTLPSANLAVDLPSMEVVGAVPGTSIEMECCCD